MQDYLRIKSKQNAQLELKVIPGHFASDRFHVNYYIDMSALKMRQADAKMVAQLMAEKYIGKLNVNEKLSGFLNPSMLDTAITAKQIDTIVCMDGCEVIGAYLADELSKVGVTTTNKHGCFYVITPEFDNTGQMVVRNNIKKMINGKNVLVVLASAMSGHTISKAIGTIKAFNGKITGLSVIFGNIDEVEGHPVYRVFGTEDLPDFKLSSPDDCDACKAGKKLDAVVNSYGYEEL